MTTYSARLRWTESAVPDLEGSATPTLGLQPRRRFTLLKSLLGLSLVALPLGAQATTFGYNTDPAGAAWNRNDPNTGFALWDIFPNTTFLGDAPDSFSANLSGATLSQSLAIGTGQGGGLYDIVTSTPTPGGVNGDVLFTGGSSVHFTLTGTVTFTIHGLVLQIKRAGATAGLNDASGFIPLLQINGGTSLSPDAVDVSAITTDTNSSGTNAGKSTVTTYFWNSSLAGTTGASTFTITMDRASMQRSLDGFAVDVGNVTVVPEPSTGLLAVASTAGLGFLRRRRSQAPAIG